MAYMTSLCIAVPSIKGLKIETLSVIFFYLYLLMLQDVFIFDTKEELFVWIGKGTTPAERKNAMTYAHVSVYQNLEKKNPQNRFLETVFQTFLL